MVFLFSVKHCATIEKWLQYDNFYNDLPNQIKKEKNMKTDNLLVGILAIVAGVLVLWMPSILTWVVGLFLIVYGILTLAGKR